ncbi:sugar transferase [Clostridia bacterium]|nr:sugar transferase [Clostridia bacterium]
MLDIVISLTAVILLSPLMIVTAILVRVKLGSPVLFRQPRPMKDGVIKELVKFKSMSDERDENGELLPDAVRLKPLGVVLRAWSIDELPSVLFNVLLKGEMSIVGPRPLLPEYLPLYNEEQRKRQLVKPGITGLAQVNGRNAISWEEKFTYDVKYVDNITFLGDIKVILLTVKKVFVREGIHSETAATMERFTKSE